MFSGPQARLEGPRKCTQNRTGVIDSYQQTMPVYLVLPLTTIFLEFSQQIQMMESISLLLRFSKRGVFIFFTTTSRASLLDTMPLTLRSPSQSVTPIRLSATSGVLLHRHIERDGIVVETTGISQAYKSVVISTLSWNESTTFGGLTYRTLNILKLWHSTNRFFTDAFQFTSQS